MTIEAGKMDQKTKYTESAAGGGASTTLSQIDGGPEPCRHRILMPLGEGRSSSSSDPTPSASDLALAGRRAANRIRLKHHFDESEEGLRLHEAVVRNDRELTFRLVFKGAGVNVLDGNRRTPLHVAAGEGAEKAVEALIESGADVGAQDTRGNTPLHDGVPPGNLNVIRFLIREGADVNLPNIDGNTPLHVAALHGNHDVAEELLKQGADIMVKNARDMTPRQEASMKRHKNVDAILDVAERSR